MKGGSRYLHENHQKAAAAGGFTIVETMIVLVVSGVLFTAVVVMLSGQQAKSHFNQAVNSVKQELEQIVNEVQSGYSLQGSYSCTVAGASAPPVISPSGGAGQGSNSGCMYLGKAVQFSTNTELTDKYAIYVLVGNRAGSSFAASRPQTDAVLMETRPLLFGLRPVQSAATGNNFGFALSTTFSQSASTASGSSGTDTRRVPDVLGHSSTNQMVNRINAAAGLRVQAPGTVSFCLRSGTTNQSGLFTIGGANTGGVGSQSTVNLVIKSSEDCS